MLMLHRARLVTNASIAFLLGLASAACTRPNPLDCSDGTCTDPAHPFCDVTGDLDGIPTTCIAVTCTPNALAGCISDEQLTCTDSGTNYTLTKCERGCDPAVGCRTCEPNQTVCANGRVQTCDASGTVIASETCPRGCFDDQPRCRDIAPSNNLAPYLDMAAAAPDIVLENVTLYSDGTLSSPPGKVAGFRLEPPLDGVPMYVIPAKTLTIKGTVRLARKAYSSNAALAFIVDGDVVISGRLTLDPTAPPGSVWTGPCVGQLGLYDIAGVGYFVGSGGGGGATRGGNGGGQYYEARQGGQAFVNPDLQPLRGGCAGGTPYDQSNGGGAIQITSRTTIQLAANAGIEANGELGFAGVTVGWPDIESIPGGGGAGGGILLEAPEVVLNSGAILVANGGAGTNGMAERGSEAVGRTPSLAKVCSRNSDICTRGGNGGTAQTTDNDAPSILYQGQQSLLTGAGGGSVGYIRINTSTGAYTKPAEVFESPAPSTGVLATR